MCRCCAGPDKEHWYYQFFETGVQPFEINLGKGRSKRTCSKQHQERGKGESRANDRAEDSG